MESVDNELVIRADREFIESVIELYKSGKSVEVIMFSLGLSYEKNKESQSWRKVYGDKTPYYIFNGKKKNIKNKSKIRDFKNGREIRIYSLISKTRLKNI